MARTQQWTILLALAATSASAVEAPIQAVTLYPGSATVERVVQVTPGMTQVEITGLLANFSTDTLRLQADPGIQVGQVVTRDQGSADSPSPRAAELEAKAQALQDHIAVIDADYKSAQLAHAYLERLGSGDNAAGRAAPGDAKTLLATLDAIRKGGSDALERMHNAEVRKRVLVKQLDVVNRELMKARAGSRENRTMTVSIAARQPGRLLLSYQVNRAGWKPTYRASLDSSASTVELERMAAISQKTGEDWSNVKLRLSTGQPTLSVLAPDPSPWLLTWRPPQEVVTKFAYAPAPSIQMRSDARSIRPMASPAPQAEADDYIAPVVETQGSFSTEYEVPAKVSLASDGREISVGLSKQDLKVEQRVRIAPRNSNDAVLTAQAPRPDGVWIAGQVQLRRDGSYVGAQHWDPQASERFSMAFGRDPLVRVAVENRNEKSGQAGLFNRDNQRRIADTYVVTSFHRQPIDILLLEPMPVSQSDKVTVKTGFSPEPTVKEWEQRRGLVGWERRLKPNETARFNVDYTIDYPKEGSVQGL
ncbi:DUF4139 domain-containing protein [Massilia yuzhufengensis]|uniref:DUF4139 domain-containing protein n=1 Tax=Massilia yuzhufengensis TaxID=1164594 RepID=A0A1I1VA66_9BURK|nr:DUF4139 domain-containing protein [Massilia yuzhufengensis]SFD79912.1 conserved hypothetical protein [Massilia yuzhufengensis]